MITLIANSGIQLHKQTVTINLQNIREKLYFREKFDLNTYRLTLEPAHYFSDDEVYVSMRDLFMNGFVPNGEVKMSWTEICNQTSDIEQIGEQEIFAISSHSLTLGKAPLIEKFYNVWLPFPYYEYNSARRIKTGPYNWSRIKIVPTGNIIDGNIEWTIVLAFDTKAIYDDGNYSDAYNECPIFPNEFEREKQFGVCDNLLNLVGFCCPPDGNASSWVDEYLLKTVHQTTDVNQIQDTPRLRYIAAYVYLMHIIRRHIGLQDVVLYKDRNVQQTINVDLVVDMGNSKTTAVLVENSDFTRTDMLKVWDLTHPEYTYQDPFDMNIAFRKANFGEMGLENSEQFNFPSFLRLGEEAKFLMYNAKNSSYSRDRLSICSSPKRYLWDNRIRKVEWENIRLENDDTAEKPIHIEGISEQLNADGTINFDSIQGENACYSRKSLMTFAFLEILTHARMYVNSHEWRERWGNITAPRKINKIVVTCPTSMSREEQIALRQAAEDSHILLKRFVEKTYALPAERKQLVRDVEIVPSVKNLKNIEERVEWTYDEATCSQFVFLCAEIAKRYKNNCEEYFNLYGKVRKDLPKYEKKSLTVGSLDIGAGTTDLMICAYEYSTSGQTTIKPVPLFWESFYIAGDDMLKAFVQQIVIEGPHAMVSNKLRKMQVADWTSRLADFFGYDNTRLSFADRELRKDFNLQISVPIALRYIEESRKQTAHCTFTWNDFFNKMQPNARLLDAFENHFGFKIQDLEWTFEGEVIDKIIVSKFDDLLKKVAAAMSAYQCDIVVLSGRPTSLKQIENLFLKYYPVSPNRLKVLNDYRVGRWYPFQNGDGYFKNQKSIVAVGALLGYLGSTQGGFDGLTLDLSELREKLLPTTEYFGVFNSSTNTMTNVLIEPNKNDAELVISDLPLQLGVRQLNTPSYPSRSFYRLDFNEEEMERKLLTKGVIPGADMVQAIRDEKASLRHKMPITLHITREDYQLDKESLIVDYAVCSTGEIPINKFKLSIQSLNEAEDFWLDSGAFNLSITTH